MVEEIQHTTITRHYRIREAVIKEALGLEGDLQRHMELWRGLSPKDEEDGVSHDDVIWEFKTVDSSEQSVIKDE